VAAVEVFAAGGQFPVHGKGPPSLDQESETYPDHQKMVLKSLSLLLPEPIHEKAVLHMAQEHANRHARPDPYCPQPGQESENEQHRPQGLDSHESSHRPRRETHACKGLKGLGDTRPAEPSQNLLGTMGKHNGTEGNPYEELSRTVVCSQ